jgi:hypothetical protein
VDEDRDHDGWVKDLVKALEDGTVLDLAPGEDVDVSQAADWPDQRRLPGEALRAALLEPDVKPDPRGLKIRGAYITGTTDLADLRLTFGLHFDSCAFEESANWPGMTVASLQLIECTTSRLILNKSRIDGLLNLSRSTFTSSNEPALNLADAEIKGGAILPRVNVTGGLRLVRTTIGAQLSLGLATLTSRIIPALELDGADIKGDALLRGLTVTGKMQASGARIGSQLNLVGAKLTNEGEYAVVLDSTEIRGSTHLERVTVTGTMRAAGAKIGGRLHLTGATLTNKGKTAVDLDWAEVKGSAFLDGATVSGEVRAVLANFGGDLNLNGAELANEGRRALSLDAARLGHVRLTPATVEGLISLAGAQIATLTTPQNMAVLTSSELSAFGWRLGDVIGPIRHDKQAAANWLSRDNSADEFVAQPWHELANVYERNGQPADARWMRWKAAQGVTRTSPRWSKLIRKIYGFLVGHGYYPLIAAAWLVLAIVLSGIIVATNPAVFTPTATNKAAWKTPSPASQSAPPGRPAPPITGAAPCVALQDRSSCLNPVLYAFDNALPGTLATGQAAQWTANGAQGWNMWVPYTLGGLKIVSWILVAFLLAGVTGLLRKT